ncbi:MAG: hypothetical protein IKP65_07720 [Alphaproteobacteria bacterium]|nr:hypothetical protein [Alphaproteobacteria bacterium]
MNRLILIDGINFFYRGAWGGGEVCTLQGQDMSYVLSYFRNLDSLVRHFGVTDKNKYIICWDGGYDERLRISSEAVQKGIIPKAYKQERRESYDVEDEEEKKKAESFMFQMKEAKKLTEYTIISQMWWAGEEADDLIGSYSVKYYNDFDEIILVTTDKDYYQLINDKVIIYNSGKNEYRNLNYLKKEYNLDNGKQWIEVGALAGETGKSSDTIYGVPGIGYITAAKLIAKYKNIDNLINESKLELSSEILKFKDVKELYDKVKSHQYKLKHHQKEMYILAHLDIVNLAKQLKAMRTFLDVPMMNANPSWIELDKAFKDMGFPVSSWTVENLTEVNKYGW